MGYIEIQINGYAGVDFEGAPLTEPEVRKFADKLRADGVEAALPTIITDDIPLMAARVAAIRKIVDADRALRKLLPAFHIEGPCMSPVEGYKGAHPQQFMKHASPDVYKPIFDAAGGPARIAIVTLSPEMDPGLKATRWLVEQGIVVAAGHTDAPLPLLRDAEAAGVSLFTHLGNGCANTIHRHDNILNRALSLEKIKYSLIPDGHHVPWFVLKSWIKLAGVERCIFTTDCMSAASAPPGLYRLGPWELEVGEDMLVRPPGKTYLAGSALTMEMAYQNAIKHLGLTPAQARALTSDQPRALIRSRLIA